MTNHMLLTNAALISRTAHRAIGQKRKYTGDDYHIHPQAVAEIVRKWGGTDSMIAAALLHDVIEDTHLTSDDLLGYVGVHVTELVVELTDVSKPSDGNRAVRKAIDRAHLAKASREAKMIKIADLMDNTASIVTHDPQFAKVYLREKQALLEVLQDGNPEMWEVATRSVEEHLTRLEHA